MIDEKIDILGIGSAIVDILVYKDDAFLVENGLVKGAMTLIEEYQMKNLLGKIGAGTECSGGTSANTLAGFSMLGGKAAFIGKVKNDQLGNTFHKSLYKSGVQFDTAPSPSGISTAQCIVFVTQEEGRFGNPPKIERTMATFLGECGEITEDDIKEDLIKSAEIVLFDGYLWDSDHARRAVHKAVALAHENKKKIAFSLSDFLCVQRHRKEFLNLVENHVNILFANESEIKSLYEEIDLRKILYRLSEAHNNTLLEAIVITRGENGSYVIMDNSVHNIAAEKVENVYDVTGAGDLYASGFLYGFLSGLGAEKSGRLGSLCASEVIKYLGARPISKLAGVLERL